LGSLLLALSCGHKQTVARMEPIPAPPSGEASAKPVFVLKSPGFQDMAVMPDRYTGKGANVSPPLEWSNPPPGTTSFAIIVNDPDAPNGTFTHWLIYNLPAASTGLSEDVPKTELLADGSRQLANDFGRPGYSGPMPPPGSLHHYHFQLYALDRMLSSDNISSKSKLLDAMNGHVMAMVQLTGVYQR